MFDKLRKAFNRDPGLDPAPSSAAPANDGAAGGPVSEWAATQGLTFSARSGNATFSLKGEAGGKAWRMEVGRPSRKYVEGEELRGRAELGVDPDVAVLLMNRPLKIMLEKQAYSLYTDGLQTRVNAHLPEGMRWLAGEGGVGLGGGPRRFLARDPVLCGRRGPALA